MRFLKILGIIFFGVLGITGIVQRNVAGGENNIYFGIICLIITAILFLSLFQTRNNKYRLGKHINSKPIHKKDIFQTHSNAKESAPSEQSLMVLSNEETKPSVPNEFSIYTITLFLNAYKKGSPVMEDNSYWSYSACRKTCCGNQAIAGFLFGNESGNGKSIKTAAALFPHPVRFPPSGPG